MAEEAHSMMLAFFESHYIEGDNMAVLRALDYCLRHELPMPAWAAKPLRKGFNRWLMLKPDASTLDEALGVERPQGKRERKAAKIQLQTDFIYLDVLLEKSKNYNRGYNVVESVYTEIARKYQIRKEKVAEICKEYETDGRAEVIKQVAFIQLAQNEIKNKPPIK